MISVNIATHSARKDFLKPTVDSLLAQNTTPDVINIYFNDYKAPSWTRTKKYSIVNPVNGKEDLGAAAKFYFSEKQDKGVYITLDDDLIAAPGYVGYLADAVMRYTGAIVGLHGTVYAKHPVQSYYSDPYKKVFYCYDGKERDSSVDMLGTGALAFHATMPNKPVLSDFEAKNSTDPYLCKKAKNNKIPLVCLVRSNGLVREQKDSQASAIWKGVASNDSKQTKLINSIKDFTRLHAVPNNPRDFGNWSLEWSHIKQIANVLSRETNFVEFGSGTSTQFLSKFTDNITSFEHDEKFAAYKVEVRPIKGGWYDLKAADITTIKKADVILVDGPKGASGERYNIPKKVIEAFSKKAIIFVDDCHRKNDMDLARKIAKDTGKNLSILKGIVKKMAVLK